MKDKLTEAHKYFLENDSSLLNRAKKHAEERLVEAIKKGERSVYLDASLVSKVYSALVTWASQNGCTLRESSDQREVTTYYSLTWNGP